MNTYATLTNISSGKTTRVLARNRAINARQYNDAVKRICPKFDSNNIVSDVRLVITDSPFYISKDGISDRDPRHIIQNPEKRYTVVYEIDQDRYGNLSGLKYAVARTAPRDNFSRKLGRTIATGRLNSDKPANVKRIPLNGKMPTTGKEWQTLENGLKAIVERDFRLKVERRYGE